ncbi:MAG: 4Fe-4S binding protein [Oscillospiraceae bacterium]
MKHLVKDDSLCIGCHQCEEACSNAFYKKADPKLSCIRILDKEDGTHEVKVCTQCGACAEVCNTGMIKKNASGVFMLNKKECVGCLMCVGFCPEDVMVQCDDRQEPSKCTACGICVKVCPTGAIKIVEE